MNHSYQMKMSLQTLEKLNEIQEKQAVEYRAIEAIKCALLENETMEDVFIDGNALECKDEYCALNYEGMEFKVEVKGNLVLDYEVVSSW